MTNSWDNLPNAKYINQILSMNIALEVAYMAWTYAYTNPYETLWDDRYDDQWKLAQTDSFTIIRDMGMLKIFDDILNLPNLNCIPDVTYDIVRNSILSLMAWDHCGYMLYSNPEELKIISKFGDERALLLLPICTIINKEKVSK